jgi:hypothetical protein
VLIAFWDGEEKGLLGSYHFLRVRPAAIAERQIVFSLNLDMIGRLRGERVEVYGARTAQSLRRAIVAANAKTNLELVFDWEITDDSDHYPFIAARIPTVMFHTGLHDQYHRPSDDTHLVNFGGIEPVVRLAFDLVVGTANGIGPLPVFRDQCRAETAAQRRALESPASESVMPAGQRPRWGMSVREDQGEPTAPIVVRVAAGSPMAESGIAVGDRIMAVDGHPVRSQQELLATLAARQSVRLDVERKGRIATVEASTPAIQNQQGSQAAENDP